jgi:hypothetical protein
MSGLVAAAEDIVGAKQRSVLSQSVASQRSDQWRELVARTAHKSCNMPPTDYRKPLMNESLRTDELMQVVPAKDFPRREKPAATA